MPPGGVHTIRPGSHRFLRIALHAEARVAASEDEMRAASHQPSTMIHLPGRGMARSNAAWANTGGADPSRASPRPSETARYMRSSREVQKAKAKPVTTRSRGFDCSPFMWLTTGTPTDSRVGSRRGPGFE